MITTTIRTSDRMRFDCFFIYRERMILATTFFLLLMWKIEICKCDLIFEGKPDDIYRYGRIKKALTWKYCELAICGSDTSRCQVLVFSHAELNCAEYTVSPFLIWLNPEVMLKDKTNFETKLKSVNNNYRSLPKPKLLWLFDAAMKGKNMGTGGSKLDLPTSNIENWGYEGPSGTKMTFIYADENSNFVKMVTPLIHNGERLLSYKPAFTISLWIRAFVKENMPLVSCEGKGLYFGLSSNLKSITFCFSNNSECFKPLEKSENQFEWRHISISHSGHELPTFYMNGNVWPISKSTNDTVLNPTNIMIRFGEGTEGFKGSMACLAIHESELTLQQIRILMNNCP